jgi:hypothetical protein
MTRYGKDCVKEKFEKKLSFLKKCNEAGLFLSGQKKQLLLGGFKRIYRLFILQVKAKTSAYL